MTRGTATWRNWAGSVTATPERVEQPGSVEEVVALVRQAGEQGRRVKAVGSGHSFSPVAHAPDVQVRLDRLTGLLAADPATRRVTLAAGTPLHAIPALLAPLGLAMENLGDIDRQTLAGAVSTGTHGTGLRFGGLATQVVGLTLVDGTGTVRTLTEEDPELAGAVVGLGALGVVTSLTLWSVDAFAQRAVERPEPLDAALDGFVERCATEDHLELYWFPHTRVALTKSHTRLPVDAPLSPLSRRQRLVDDELLSNGVYAVTCRVGARVPGAVPTVNRLAASLVGDRTFTDLSHRVFASPRRVRFHETEWAVPLEVVREVVARIWRHGWRVSFPLEVRAAAPRLRTTGGSPPPTAARRGYVAAHRYHREDPTTYVLAVQDICRASGQPGPRRLRRSSTAYRWTSTTRRGGVAHTWPRPCGVPG